MNDQFNQERMKEITNKYKFISTFAICFISCATALFHYADQLLLMGYLEFFGYSMNIVKTTVFERLGIILEVLKLCFFIITVQVLGWHIIKSKQEIQKAIMRILISLKTRNKGNGITIKNLNVKIIGCVLHIFIYALCGWLALQFTGHLIASGIERSLRMFGYTEGVTDIESDLFWIFRSWFVSMPKLFKPRFSYWQALVIKYTICIAPYAPTIVYLLIRKIRHSSSQTSRIIGVAVSVLCVAALYSLLNFNISGTLYLVGQQRAQRDQYFDTVVLDDVMYVVAYETDTHLFLTKCEYVDEGECLYIDTEYRLCLNREGVLIEEFPVYGNVKSNSKVSDFD